ncbi:MAG: right-handed parallel beta-helix repeat-containing protein, partial [Pirellulales bacterium]
MGEFVYRNYNVIVGKRKDVTVGVQAINPLTNLPFVIQHIGPGGNSSGAPDDPWGSIADAQTAGGDVIVVHAGTVLTESIILQDGDVIIGQGGGIQEYLNIKGYGAVAVPKVGTATDVPIIQGVDGNEVTMANNSVFAGFIIDTPTGHGIFANGVHDSLVSNVSIRDAGGDGVLLQNTTSSFHLGGVEISDAAGAGLHVSGGSADVSYTGRIETSTGRSILIADTTDGLVSLAGTTVVDDGGDGVQLLDNDGDIVLSNLTVKNTSGVGVEIRGGAGHVALLSDTRITDAGGTGLLIADREGNTLVNKAEIEAADGEHGIELSNNDGETWFNAVDVEAENGTAIYARDSERFSIAGGEVNSDGG